MKNQFIVTINAETKIVTSTENQVVSEYTDKEGTAYIAELVRSGARMCRFSNSGSKKVMAFKK